MTFVNFPNLNLEIPIEKTAFTFMGINIQWYAIIIATGFLIAFIYAMYKSKAFGLDKDKVFDVAFWGTLGGIVGARLYYVAFNLDYYLKNPAEIIMTREGGMAIYGGIIGAIIVGVILCKIKKVKILPLFDMAAIGFLIGQGIGRWGNFINEEAYGSATSSNYLLGMNSPSIARDMVLQTGEYNADILVHPCFLYESIWCLIGAALLFSYIKKRKFDGEISLLYLLWYGAERTVVEGLRTDSLYIGNSGIRVSQLLSAVLAIAALSTLVYFYIRISKYRKTDQKYMQLYAQSDESIIMLDEIRIQIETEKQKRIAKKSERRKKIKTEKSSEKTEDNKEQD